MKVGIIRCIKRTGLSIRVLLITMALCYPLLSCGHEKKASSAEEREYPEALFTLGEMASVELEMPEATWQAIITKASGLKRKSTLPMEMSVSLTRKKMI